MYSCWPRPTPLTYYPVENRVKICGFLLSVWWTFCSYWCNWGQTRPTRSVHGLVDKRDKLGAFYLCIIFNLSFNCNTLHKCSLLFLEESKMWWFYLVYTACKSWLLSIVIYFTQQLVAAHSKCWSKYAFSMFFVLKS